jgi:hypothetical protein
MNIFSFLFIVTAISACDLQQDDFGRCGQCVWKDLVKFGGGHIEFWQECQNIQWDPDNIAASRCMDADVFCVFEDFAEHCDLGIAQ